jgi:hypothetical protein
LTWEDGLPAYTFAAWRRWFVGYIQLLAGHRSILVLFVLLTFVLRDAWLLLGIPAAYLGTAVGAPGHDAHKRPARVFMTAFALFGLVFGLFSGQGWRSAVFLNFVWISCFLCRESCLPRNLSASVCPAAAHQKGILRGCAGAECDHAQDSMLKAWLRSAQPLPWAIVRQNIEN